MEQHSTGQEASEGKCYSFGAVHAEYLREKLGSAQLHRLLQDKRLPKAGALVYCFRVVSARNSRCTTYARQSSASNNNLNFM